ncbi:hypothetical protein CRG98_003176 [Punica granatum]|uniref:Uncharacterized protein n=1 Tax=Punica granatum TaxID=22663 RepID=A0A2I0L6R0_PUNGR|nr:hypothetical protein CRG98_003176 [Punica granatum]
MHNQYDEESNSGEGQPMFVINSSNKKALGMSSDGFHKNNVYGTLEYFSLEGLQGDAGGRGGTNYLQLVSIEESEWESQLEKQRQKLPCRIDLLGCEDCEELKIDGALPSDGPISARRDTPRELVAVLRPSSFGSSSVSTKLAQKFIIKENIEMTMEVKFISAVDKSQDDHVYSLRKTPSSHEGLHGLYVFAFGSKFPKSFRKVGVYGVGSCFPRSSIACYDSYENRVQFTSSQDITIFDAYGNHVSEDTEVPLVLDGFYIEDEMGLKHKIKVDSNGFVDLSGILKVVAYYGKKVISVKLRAVSLSILSDGESIFSIETQTEEREMTMESRINVMHASMMENDTLLLCKNEDVMVIPSLSTPVNAENLLSVINTKPHYFKLFSTHRVLRMILMKWARSSDILRTYSKDEIEQFMMVSQAKYLGEDQMLAVVCRSYDAAFSLKKYELNGEVDARFALYAKAAELGVSMNGQFLVVCLDDIMPYAGDFYGHNSERELKLPEPFLPTGEIPQGFIGYAVNMIDIETDSLGTRTGKGGGLRETLFYCLFGELQVNDTRENVKEARMSIKHGAVSVNGGILRENGLMSLGYWYLPYSILLVLFPY